MPTGDASATSIADGPLQTAAGGGFRTRLAGLGDRLETLFERERDQLPLWLPVGLELGVAAWFWLPDASGWTGFLLGAAAAGCVALAAGAGTRWGRALAIFCVAAALGCALIWIKADRAAAPRLEYARMAELTARIETVQRLPAKEAVRLLVRPADATLAHRLRINVDDKKASPALQPGAVIRLKATSSSATAACPAPACRAG